MERNAGVTARAGPGWDFGNAEVVVSQTLPLLALQERSHPHPCDLGSTGVRTRTPISLGQKPQCQTTPKSRGLQDTSGHGFLTPAAFPKKIPPNQIHQRTKAQRIKLGVFSPKAELGSAQAAQGCSLPREGHRESAWGHRCHLCVPSRGSQPPSRPAAPGQAQLCPQNSMDFSTFDWIEVVKN